MDAPLCQCQILCRNLCSIAQVSKLSNIGILTCSLEHTISAVCSIGSLSLFYSIVNRWATKEAKKAIIYEVCECKSHFSIQWTSWDMGINPSIEIWSRSMRTKRKYKASIK